MRLLISRLPIQIAAAVMALTVLLSAADAQSDWPRFRGVDGKGVSAETVPTKWSPEENIKWKTELPGAGCSSPIVVSDKVFVTCYSGYGESRQNIGSKDQLKRHIVCIDRTSGQQQWSKIVAGTPNEDDYAGIGVTAHGYASHTPVSDGKHLFVFFGKSGVIAYDLDGNEIWSKKVGDRSDSRKWGSGASPVIYGDVVIVPALAENRAVVALDKKTGEQRWIFESEVMDKTWATPIVVPVDDQRSDLVIGVPNELWAINPETGKLRWAASGVGGDGFYTSAIAGGDVIYASVGGRSGGGTIAVKSGGKKDVTESHVSWNGRTQASFATPLIHDGILFIVARGGVMNIIDAASGKELKKVRLESTADSKPQKAATGGRLGSADYGSPVLAGDYVYFTKGNGETFVLSADKECQQVAVNKLTDEAETFSGTPAISNGQLLIRSNKYLYCIGE